MKISLNWIKRLIPDLKIESYDDFFKRMVEIGLDIESIEYEGDKFKNFVIGEVIETQKHPNADKLTVCKVNIGNEVLNIVCGASNVKTGQKVCVAKIGAIIPNGGFEIKKNKLRGELSEGMICAEDELGLSTDHSGIMVLNEKAEAGKLFSEYIGADDYFIEIGVTPNRGDLFSQIGMAREIAGAFGLKTKLPDIELIEIDEKTSDYIQIEIESKEYCKRFTGRIVKNVEIKESPEWLKKAIESVGLRPINNIVDITNYVMMETGQPLHAFDYDKIAGKMIIVKTANEGEKFITLDSKERILNQNSLMVFDAEKPIGIAGVMGGEFSEISDKTKNVLIEVAYFDPVCIRKNSKKLGLQTDASQRFERGVDIDNILYVSKRTASLIQKVAGGEILKGVVDNYPEKFNPLEVSIRAKRCSSVCGIEFTEDKIISLLNGIEISFIKKEEDELWFSIPEFRREDIQREIDLIEEVIRLYGYANIKCDYNNRIDVSIHTDYDDNFLKFTNDTRNYFVGRGFNEIITYSQQDDKKISIFNKDLVLLENPNSVVMNSMRVNLAYGMLSTIATNYNNLGKDISLKLFEIGKVFSQVDKKFKEEYVYCFALTGETDKNSYDEKQRHFDYADIKGELEMLLSKMNIENYEIIYYYEDNSIFEIKKNDKVIGRIYNFDAFSLSKDIGIENDVYIVEIFADIVFELSIKKLEYSDLSKYPSVKRDIAVIGDSNIKFQEIYDLIKSSGGKLLNKIELFDIYKGDKIGTGKKSLAFSLEFLSYDKTLTDEEISKQINKIVKNLEQKLNLQLRIN